MSARMQDDGLGGPAGHYVAVAAAADVAEGAILAVQHGGTSLLICRDGQHIHAVENNCPHQSKELTGGRLRNGQIICPWHGARFALDSGASQGIHTNCPILTFPVRVVDGWIEVALAPAPSA